MLFADRGSAQEAYPNKPVKIVVGMPAGSFTDLSARLIGDSLRQDLKESFVIENRPGAATNIATQAVARAPKDGYTLLLSSNSNAMNVSLFKDLPFDVVKDFQPVAMIASSSFILAVTPSLPVSNLKELIAYAKSQSGRVEFRIDRIGDRQSSRGRNAGEAGRYQGRNDLLQGLDGRSRRRDCAAAPTRMFAPGSSAMPHVQAGKLKAIAVTSGSRTSLAPDLPTMSEAGAPGYEVTMWNGLFAPTGTPPEVVEKLAAAATKAVASQELQSKIKNNGGDPIVMGPKEFADYLQKDIRRWSDASRRPGSSRNRSRER